MLGFKRFASCFVACCGSLTMACAADEESERLSLVTFNALVAEHGPHLDERLTAIGKAVNQLRPDVLCLQEVWLLEHVEKLVDAVHSTLPYAFYTIRESTGSTSCEPSEREALVACVNANCGDVSTDELPSCAVSSCSVAFTNVSRSCQECVLSNAEGAESIDSIAAACTEGSDGVAYERQNGLILLSAFPFREKSEIALTSHVFERGVLHAELDVGFAPRLDVFCTHLAATLDLEADPDDETNEERAQQIDETLAFIDEEHSKGDVSVLLGDMNCGPDTDEVAGADTKDFERLTARGLESPYSKAPFCTWCAENNLVADTDDDQRIDHILFADLPDRFRTTTRRVFDERATFEIDGKTISSALSDHYGVRTLLSE
jgi:endonuclease/exonuclease/phosphatase family metal-dependent hydrolase